MEKTEFWKIVEKEMEWFTYYGLKDDRKSVDMDKPLYDQVRSIGYTKVVTPLDIRCTGLSGILNEEITLENKRRNPEENRFTPMELWLMKYPEDKQKIYNKINRYG